MEQHSHSYSGKTTFNKGHIHNYGGVTSISPSGVPHMHILQGVTSYILGHMHNYVTKTGPAIHMANGLHYHEFETRIELAKGHIHYISGYTSAD